MHAVHVRTYIAIVRVRVSVQGGVFPMRAIPSVFSRFHFPVTFLRDRGRPRLGSSSIILCARPPPPPTIASFSTVSATRLLRSTGQLPLQWRDPQDLFSGTVTRKNPRAEKRFKTDIALLRTISTYDFGGEVTTPEPHPVALLFLFFFFR